MSSLVYASGGGGSSSIVVNTTAITGGVSGRLLYDNAGTVGEVSGATWNGTRAYIPSIQGSRTISADYVVLSSDQSIFFDADSAAIDVTVTLPLASANPGKIVSLTKINSGAHYAFFTPSGSDTIIGNLSPSQFGYGDGLTVQSDGVDKWVQIAFTQSPIFIGAPVTNGVHNSVMYTDNIGTLASNASLGWDGTTLTVGEPGIHESQINFATFAGRDGGFLGSSNGGPISRISSPYFAFCLATNPGGDNLGTGIIGVNGLPSLVEWNEAGDLYFNGLKFPGADGTVGQTIVTNGSGVLSFADVTAINANYLYDTSMVPVISVDGVARILYAADGTTKIIDYSNALTGASSIEFGGNKMRLTAPIIDGSAVDSIYTDLRMLLASNGTTVNLDWNTANTVWFLNYNLSAVYAAGAPGDMTIAVADTTDGVNLIFNGGSSTATSTSGGELQFHGGSGVDGANTPVLGAKILLGSGQADGSAASLSLYLGAPVGGGGEGVFSLVRASGNTILTAGNDYLSVSSTTKIGFNGATPVTQSSAIPDASSGTVQDAEARAALNTLLAYLRTRGDIHT